MLKAALDPLVCVVQLCTFTRFGSLSNGDPIRGSTKSYSCWKRDRGCTLAGNLTPRPAGERRRQEKHSRWARGYPHPNEPTTSLSSFCSRGSATAMRAELIKLAVRKIVEEALEGRGE